MIKMMGISIYGIPIKSESGQFTDKCRSSAHNFHAKLTNISINRLAKSDCFFIHIMGILIIYYFVILQHKIKIIMKIYYNKFFKGQPYVGLEDGINFDTCYCDDISLLSLMMLHGGIPQPSMTPEERRALYHNHIKECNLKGSIFEKSFKLDSYAVACKILEWRDALVSAGWDLKECSSKKLDFIKSVEPQNFPKGLADCWCELLDASGKKRLIPEDSEIIVTHKKDSLDPKIKAILDNQKRLGVAISYLPDTDVIAKGDLGRLQEWFLSENPSPVKLEFDDSISLLHFHDDNEAFRYVATESPEKWNLYLCQQPKQFDNILKYLGEPVSGSDIPPCVPQVVQLFTLGNGLFEFPLNIPRIIAWLDAPINPLPRKLCRRLVNVLVSSGGIGNEQWDKTIEEYLLEMEEEEKKPKNIYDYLPIPGSNALLLKDVKDFNKNLYNWAIGLVNMEKFPYELVVKEQLAQISLYTSTLLTLLESIEGETILFTELQNLCNSIVSEKVYPQYQPEAGSRCTLSKIGNIQSSVESLLWFCIFDEGAESFPFDFLTDSEFNQLKEAGVNLFDRDFHSKRRKDALAQTILRTKKLTLIETDKVNGEETLRNPLMILLNEFCEGTLNVHFNRPELPDRAIEELNNINNRRDEEILQIEEGVSLDLRSEKGSAESYSSLDMLLEHPFDYVCRYIARFGDISIPSLEDIDRTMGNVAHLLIEMVYDEPDLTKRKELMNINYENTFNKAVNACGMLLLQPEFSMQYKELKYRMKQVLIDLDSLISRNNLTVSGCEIQLGGLDLGYGGKLESRADMLLTDKEGNRVVFDFKWTRAIKKYEKLIRDNRSLQLAIYAALEKHNTGRSVRSAYLLLPSLTLISADSFIGGKIVESGGADLMKQALNGYEFRRNQFEQGIVERAEGFSRLESQYGVSQESCDLYPLPVDKDEIVKNSYNEFNKLR